MAPAVVMITAERLAHLEARVRSLDAELADYASRCGMTDEARRLLMVEPQVSPDAFEER